MKSISLQTKRLCITPRNLAEMMQLQQQESNPDMQQAYCSMAKTMQELPGQEEWGTNWKIALQDGTEVGGLCFKGAPDENGSVEIGYGIEELHRCNGYATEAVMAATKWALSHQNVKSVTAQTDPDNIISQKVLLHNGFVPSGMGEEGNLYKIEQPALEVCFFDNVEDSLLKYAVIISKHQGKWVFCRHKKRNTYECPGGRREPGETIDNTARRELYEETGALEYTLQPVCVYSVMREGEESFGMLYFADITSFGPLPQLEIERIEQLEQLPQCWTYPLIQPKLIEKVLQTEF